MKQLAPQTVGVAPRLVAAGWMAIGRHVPIIGTVTTGGVLIAVTHFENLANRVGKRFATGTPGAGNDRAIGSLLAHRRGSHRTGRRGSSTVTLAAVDGSPERKSAAGPPSAPETSEPTTAEASAGESAAPRSAATAPAIGIT